MIRTQSRVQLSGVSLGTLHTYVRTYVRVLRTGRISDEVREYEGYTCTGILRVFGTKNTRDREKIQRLKKWIKQKENSQILVAQICIRCLKCWKKLRNFKFRILFRQNFLFSLRSGSIDLAILTKNRIFSWILHKIFFFTKKHSLYGPFVHKK